MSSSNHLSVSGMKDEDSDSASLAEVDTMDSTVRRVCLICGNDKNVFVNLNICSLCKMFGHRNKRIPFECLTGEGNCEVSVFDDPICKSCRLQKYKSVMTNLKIDRNCKVCGDKTTGMFSGIVTCANCRNFYSYARHERIPNACTEGGTCEIKRTQSSCRYCRLKIFFDKGYPKIEGFPTLEPNNDDQFDESYDDSKVCGICGDDKFLKMHLGGLKCRFCQEFYLRQRSKEQSKCIFENEKCYITVSNRQICGYCRLKKYFTLAKEAGYLRQVTQKPTTDDIPSNLGHSNSTKRFKAESVPRHKCKVCTVRRRMKGVETCLDCGTFLREQLSLHKLQCISGTQDCEISKTRKCKYCRFKKCLRVIKNFDEFLISSSNNEPEERLEDDPETGNDRHRLPEEEEDHDSKDERDEVRGNRLAESLRHYDYNRHSPRRTRRTRGRVQSLRTTRSIVASQVAEVSPSARAISQEEEDSNRKRRRVIEDDFPTSSPPKKERKQCEDTNDGYDDQFYDYDYEMGDSSTRRERVDVDSPTSSSPRKEPMHDSFPYQDVEKGPEQSSPKEPSLQRIPSTRPVSTNGGEESSPRKKEKKAEQQESIVAGSSEGSHGHEIVSENFEDPSTSNPRPANPIEESNLLAEEQKSIMIQKLTDGYITNCKYHSMKESRDSLTLKKNPDDSVETCGSFYDGFYGDIEKIHLFLKSAPLLNELKDAEKAELFKNNIFPVWMIWSLNGIDKEKFIFPNGEFYDCSGLEVVLGAKVTRKMFDVAEKLKKLDLNSNEISILTTFLFLKSKHTTKDPEPTRADRYGELLSHEMSKRGDKGKKTIDKLCHINKKFESIKKHFNKKKMEFKDFFEENSPALSDIII